MMHTRRTHTRQPIASFEALAAIPDLPTPAAVIAAVRARGNDALDLRDATHEACHALDAGLETGWTREAIHQALRRKHSAVAELFQAEVLARAVEQIACADLGVDPGTSVEGGAIIATFEAIKSGLPYTDPDTFVRIVKVTMGSARARAMVESVLSLAAASAPTSARRRRK